MQSALTPVLACTPACAHPHPHPHPIPTGGAHAPAPVDAQPFPPASPPDHRQVRARTFTPGCSSGRALSSTLRVSRWNASGKHCTTACAEAACIRAVRERCTEGACTGSELCTKAACMSSARWPAQWRHACEKCMRVRHQSG